MNWHIFFIVFGSFILGACAGILIVVREVKNSLK